MKLFFVLFAAVFVYLVQAYIYKRYWDEKLYTELSFSKNEVYVGEQLELVEELRNEKRIPLSVLLMKFSCPKCFCFSDEEHLIVTDSCYRSDTFLIGGYQRIVKNLSFCATRRGYYKIRNINLLTRDYFLTRQYAKMVESKQALTVVPKPYDDVKLEELYNQLLGEMMNQNSLIDNPYSFSGIRDYTNNDSIRLINWKATAHTNQLMVNVYEHTSAQQIKILLNLEPPHSSSTNYLNECAISIVSSCMHRFIGEQIPVAFASNGLDVVTGECDAIAAGVNQTHIMTMNRCLARLGETAGIAFFNRMLEEELVFGRSDITYIIVSPYHKEPLLRRIDEMVEKGMLVQLLAPCYSYERDTTSRPYMHRIEFETEG